MIIEREETQRDPHTGSVETVRTEEHTPSATTVERAGADRAEAYVWYVVGLIDVLLALRLLFLLLGANNTGFASILYQVTLPLMILYRGIFPAPGTETGYFDTASVLAIIVYSLIGWGIVSLIAINRRKLAE